MKTSKNILVIVDAWKHCEVEDLIHYPQHSTETKLFGTVINHYCDRIKERNQAEIYHFASNREIMDEIGHRENVIENILDLPKRRRYFFCGFHLGRCINNNIKLLEQREPKQRIGIVLNLSQLFVDNSIDQFLERNTNTLYYYSIKKGFESIVIDKR